MKKLFCLIFLITVFGCTNGTNSITDSIEQINNSADSWYKKTKPTGEVEYKDIKEATKALKTSEKELATTKKKLQQAKEDYEKLDSSIAMKIGRSIEWLVIGWIALGIIGGIFNVGWLLDFVPLANVFKLLGRFRK